MEREWTWADCAKYCEENYGIFVDWDEEYFICPECGELVYAEDWHDIEFAFATICPICQFDANACRYDDEDK